VRGSLTVNDTSAGQTGLITGANNANVFRGRGNELLGGGVCVDGGTLTLNGGAIANNESADGAGVQLVRSSSTFRMNGGSVSDNVASEFGGGIHVAYGSTLKITGGEITGNVVSGSSDNIVREAGAGIYAQSSFEIEGSPRIADNTAGDGQASNVYLANKNWRVRVTGKLTPPVPIGIATTEPRPVTYITDGLTSNGRVTDFVADDPEQIVAPDGDEVVMRKPNTMTFDAGGEDVEGEMEDGSMSYNLAFTLPDAVYDKKILVLVAMSKAEVMETVSLSNSMYSEVHPIGMINKGHDVSMPVMQMAKRLNYFYSCSFSGKGVPTSMPKDEIEEKWAQQTSVALRFSNIYNSMTLPTKMRSLGHDENDWDKFYAMTKDEIRQTAAVEHNRWSVERLILGFRPPTDSERAEIEENIEQLAAARRRGEKSELNDFKNMYKKRKIHYDLCSYAELGIDKTGQDVRIYDYDLTACIPLIANSYHEDGQEHA
jgi:hypothetical protein